MSVIIRCMDMPECCMDCPFLRRDEILVSGKEGLWKHIYNCIWCPEEEEDGWHDVNWVAHNRQEWCPLEEVEKHTMAEYMMGQEGNPDDGSL